MPNSEMLKLLINAIENGCRHDQYGNRVFDPDLCIKQLNQVLEDALVCEIRCISTTHIDQLSNANIERVTGVR